ncbi:MAG: hypothetical protein QNL33_14620 [Akkermansiaceae bacterium]
MSEEFMASAPESEIWDRKALLGLVAEFTKSGKDITPLFLGVPVVSASTLHRLEFKDDRQSPAA